MLAISLGVRRTRQWLSDYLQWLLLPGLPFNAGSADSQKSTSQHRGLYGHSCTDDEQLIDIP